MKYSLIFLFATIVFGGFSQTKDIRISETDADFPGGAAAMTKFISEQIEYPEIAREYGDQGRVYVTFIVERDGSLTNIEIFGEGLTPELNQEAMRVVSVMPKWVPGAINGEAVRARCRLPITFSLVGKPPRKIRRQQKRNR